MAENNDPASQSALTPVPRRHITPPPAPPADSSRREQLADLVDSVKVLADQINGEPADAADPANDRAARRKKKFQRTGQSDDRRIEDLPAGGDASPDDGEPPSSDAAPEDGTDATSLNRNIAWPRLTRPNVPTTLTRSKRKRRSTTGPLLVLLGCNLVMLLLGYLVALSLMPAAGPQTAANPSSSPAAVVVADVSAGVRDSAMDAADAALKAEKTGDADTARRVYENAVRLRLGLWGTEYRLAMMAIKRGDLLDADLHLIHSTAAGEFVGPCHFIRATFAGARGNYAEAAHQFEAAAHVEPFNGKYFFCWGECLRRQGKPHAALNCFEQALTRPYNPEDGDLYLFKSGLARIEFANDEGFKTSLASHLQKANVAGDWWLLAAAQDLQQGAFPAAAEHLQKAAQAMPPAVFDARVRDYFFQAFVKRPELAALLTRPPAMPASEAGASVLDPASWPPEKADPGAWPSAAH